MVADNNILALNYVKESPGIVRFEVKSRHIGRKTYTCYIHYNPNAVGIDSIEGYCWNCANGLRTIGCCSHVASLIYHLSYGKFLSRVICPAAIFRNLFNAVNIYPVIAADSDED